MTAVSPDLLRRFDVSGPRYTSYPTADRFVDAFGADDYIRALEHRRIGSAVTQPLSLYVHIPFCESLCYYCACNKIITRHHERAGGYLRYLGREVDLHVDHAGTGQMVSQLHLGGGTPTFLSDEELHNLMAMLRRSFTFAPGGEYSIEVDPRTVDAQRLATLAELGFNRLSFGVQDFDPAVQKAVHRIQPAQQVFDLVASARSIGFESINVDLIYGLPQQTPESFDRTLAQVVELRPDRIALYAYAHVRQRPFDRGPGHAHAVVHRHPEGGEAGQQPGMTTGAEGPVDAVADGLAPHVAGHPEQAAAAGLHHHDVVGALVEAVAIHHRHHGRHTHLLAYPTPVRAGAGRHRTRP